MSLERFTSLTPAKDLPQLQAALEARATPRSRSGTSRGWYSITNVSQTEVEVLIYDYIGVGGISADEFIQELNSIKANNITLRINSNGGDVFDGFAIFNAIHRHKAKVTAYVDSIAASAASFIVMAADEIVMSPHSQLMIHDAQGLALGSAGDMQKMAGLLDKVSDNIASVYAERTGKSVPEWRALMKEETWFSDEEAVAAGLADRVDGEDEEAVAARAAARIQNVEPAPEFTFGIADAIREGTSSVVRKETVQPFDFAKAVKAGTAAA